MEEKTGKIQKTTQSSSHGNDRSQSDTIALDLIIEILSRLPAKSIMRFRCVSNLWSAITTTPQFIRSFTALSPASRPSVLVIDGKDNLMFVFSSHLHKNSPNVRLSCVGSYQFTRANYSYPRGLNNVHGLICFEDSKQFVIWNPTLKSFSTLPQLENTRGRDFLGYDPIDGKYKVLRILTQFKICILTLGAQGSSRIITKGFPRHRTATDCWRCINGVIYYAAYVDVDNGFRCIMSFDVRTEKFNPIKYPDEGYDLRFSLNMIIPYEGRLAMFRTYYTDIDIWILMDGDGNKWMHKRFFVPKKDLVRKKEVCFDGVNDAGEFVFAPRRFYESFYIQYFDASRNSIREVLVEGNVGDEFRRRYGLGNNHVLKEYSMRVLPNHIETLVSL